MRDAVRWAWRPQEGPQKARRLSAEGDFFRRHARRRQDGWCAGPELMQASRRMISGSYLLARIRTGWDFREPQVTVSQTCFRAPNLLPFGHSSTEIPVGVAP
jgi:hypothetical protein